MKELVANRLWTREMPFTLFGLKVSTRMSVVPFRAKVAVSGCTRRSRSIVV